MRCWVTRSALTQPTSSGVRCEPVLALTFCARRQRELSVRLGRMELMYVLRPGTKDDPVRRWALPDRVFFASGACHILAYAFLSKYAARGYSARWIKPAKGYTGNHIVAVQEDSAFDYHGYSNWADLLLHMQTKAERWWPGWSAEIIPLPFEFLISEEKSRTFDGLWLREPKQFLHDALPRAENFLSRFGNPPPSSP